MVSNTRRGGGRDTRGSGIESGEVHVWGGGDEEMVKKGRGERERAR